MTITLPIPDLSLVVLIGPSGSGKSTFARRHFKPTEILTSDYCRALVADNENDQTVTEDAFDILHYIAAKRLAHGRLTVVDATNVQPEARQPLVALARQYHCLPVAIVLNMPEKLCYERNEQRPDRDFGPHVVRRQRQQLRRSLKRLKREGFRYVFQFNTPEEVEAITVERQPLWNNRQHERGPFDIIGDIHGCCDELELLLAELGYEPQVVQEDDDIPSIYVHPEGRKAIFLGDLVDRGPRILDTYRLVRQMVEAEQALCVPGNHDIKLMRKLRGRDVRINHGLEQSLAEIEALPDSERAPISKEIADFINSLVSHYMLDRGKLVVAHAGMKAEMQGRGSAKVRDFALYGETTGETDEFGLPIRHNWAAEYRGHAMVVYGHTPVPAPEWLNNSINIDTGCVFGGRLTALRYPEREIVSVPAARVYATPARPLHPVNANQEELTTQQRHDELLALEDVSGKRHLNTRLRRTVIIREENAIAALEVMSRFAANPKWLIYLPPTMSPSATSQEAGLLEHPAEAFSYYRQEGVTQVICQEKHMGSRAIVIVCRDETAARTRFGTVGEGIGICYTRTGRRFFTDPALETDFLDRVKAAIEAAGWWEQFKTDWVCLDCELMPWSVKAQELLRQQYAAVGAAARPALSETLVALGQTPKNRETIALLESYQQRSEQVGRYVEAYRRYCWPVASLGDLKLAPFHLLATEGKVHVDQDHRWHMETLAQLSMAEPSDENSWDGLLLATPYRLVDVTNPTSCQRGIDWWMELTGRGGEGMVVKPLPFIVQGKRGLIQPAIKTRGREYLRIIYGPEYTNPAHLERLRLRGLSAKRSLALREFALGIEALERFTRREPLRRVHECVFGVLALESEPVDPRL